MHILVIALNPAMDVEWQVSNVRWEEKNVIRSERRWPGGKGVNVARWLKFLRARPRLLLPLGGQTGEDLATGLRQEGLTAGAVPLHEPTRSDIIVSTASQGQLRFNPPGPKLSAGEWREIVARVERELRTAKLLVVSGSLPRGVPVAAYAGLIRRARRVGVRTILDCDGPAFAAAVKAQPFLVKPNEQELAQWWGRPLPSPAAIRKAASELSALTGGWVLVSRGRHGAFLVDSQHKCELEAQAPLITALNTVGAGDAMLAAVASRIQRNTDPGDWLRWGVAAGSTSARCLGGQLPGRTALRRALRQVRARAAALA